MAKKELHIISTGEQTMDELVHIAACTHQYVDYIHVREKNWSAKQLYEVIGRLVEAKVPLSKIILNDRVDVAWARGVSGVQLAHHSMDVKSVYEAYKGLRIGKSVHSIQEALAAEREGADYVLFGHLFDSGSKLGLQPKGVEELSRVTKSVDLPVIAIGGIKPEHVENVLGAGAAGIAVMSGVFRSVNPVYSVKEYTAEMKRFHRTSSWTNRQNKLFIMRGG
ncbi:thiamine phosphate synthase [Sporosarcina luteola]|uniref:Thiamine phosphate synthase n=1 Tax=Sporosarcina luteola TaxID=582850 RepID=A0A511Z611_9BACL|nr:thiazole tautomerase TenI [Sporosarcina luteola]GEN82880.1 thiamine phosphate synthase [Sporosarcina luteola]